MRPKGSKAELEIRRRTAVALRRSGLSVREVAKQVGCVPSSVVRWTQAYERDGADGLKSKPQAGSKPRLSDAQKERLRSMLLKGARSFGWETDLWTVPRVAKLIEKKFGIQYHVSHVHRLLRQMAFSPQKPAQRPREQDRDAIEHFRRQRWPAIKGRPAAATAPSF